MKRFFLLILFVPILISCGKDSKSTKTVNENVDVKKYSKFNGSYAKTFNDLHDLHTSAAQAKGIKPMRQRADTIKYLERLIRLPDELDLYKMDKLTYSIPYVVEDASKLIMKIGYNFKDSLKRKNLPQYKIIITSVTRTQEDVDKLTKRNTNASENSTHCYGTTFDISWRRFEKEGSDSTRDISTDRLKLVLGEVLHDLRQRNMCYVMHEKKQACFHITVR